MELDENGLTPREEIRVGPVDTPLGVTYLYRIGDRISERRYANAASAWADARRPQRVSEAGRLAPVPRTYTLAA